MAKRRGDTVATAERPKWLGGFIRKTKAGRPVYVIERHIRGEYFKVSTRCHTEDAAVKELRKFEADPARYKPGAMAALPMTDALILQYRDWQLEQRGNTYDWARETAGFLADWMEDFAGEDLRRLSITEHVKPALLRRKSGPGRITALKGFFTWLRKERGLLKHFEDPMPDMRIPKRTPRRDWKPRDVPFDRVELVYRHLRADLRDVLLLLSGTGWHLSEVRRFAEAGEIRPDVTGKHLAVLVTWHKRKENAVTGLVHQEHVDAARRLREQGHMLSNSTLAGLMRRACKAAGLPRSEWFGLGDMRHSVSTWAIELGDDMQNVARAFNHESEAMLRRHYVRHAVPRATVATMPLLLH